MSELAQVATFSIILLSIINPLGAIPIFLSMTSDLSSDHRVKMSRACAMAVFVTLIVSLAVGQKILKLFGISVASFSVAGGILIFSMGMSMIKAKNVEAKLNQHEMDDTSLMEIGIVPLAIPLLSGPGAISSAIIYAKSLTSPLAWIYVIVAAFLISAIIYLTLSRADLIKNKIGDLGLNVMTRVMGLILLAMAIEMVLGGVKDIIPVLKAGIS